MQLKEQKIIEIRNELEQLIGQMEEQTEKGLKIHEVERELFRNMLRLGRQLLEYYILLLQLVVNQGKSRLDSQGAKLKNTGLRSRPYRSIFGKIRISRPKYYSSADKRVYYDIDQRLGLPKDNYSYVLKDWLADGSTEMDFDQSASQLKRILGQDLHGMQSSRMAYEVSEQVDQFYEQKDWLAVEDGPYLSVGYDGKGVPIMRSQTDRAEESVSTRLAKGQKKGVKKEATLSLSSCFTPRKRSVEEILNSLFSPRVRKTVKPKKKKHRWHENKHIRAFLSDKARAICYGIENLLERDETQSKPIVVLIDGDRALENAVNKVAADKGIDHRIEAYILDFIHLLEYVWKVANAYYGEKHEGRADWVKEQARLLLNSEHEKVLEQWKKIAEEENLSKNRAYNLQRGITYLSNRPHMLDYKSYLEKGFPITTGAVESACGHFVKSRMERNAMHWSMQGAQKMLNIRAIKKNGDWEQYMEHFIDQEQKHLYGKAA